MPLLTPLPWREREGEGAHSKEETATEGEPEMTEGQREQGMAGAEMSDQDIDAGMAQMGKRYREGGDLYVLTGGS